MKHTIVVALFIVSGCHVTVTDHCTDGVLDGSESDIDCGGVCAPCGIGRACFVPGDCASGACVNNICAQVVTASCTDLIQNGNETDVDCGGSCAPCGVGRQCVVPADCTTGQCQNNRCIDPSFSQVPQGDIYTILGGAGIIVQPGTQAGYGITAAQGGSSFRLVWTGDGTASGQYHEFYGSVYTDGFIDTVTPGCSGACSFPSGAYVSQPYQITGGDRVDFDSFNANDLEGFDFTVSGGAMSNGEPVLFDLYIDGQYHPELVFFTDSTGVQGSPQTIPFGVITQ